MSIPASINTENVPELDLETFLTVISVPARWRILQILARGEGYGIPDFAHALRISYSSAHQHVTTLNNAGIIIKGRGNLYKLRTGYEPLPGTNHIDLGFALLRLDHTAVKPA